MLGVTKAAHRRSLPPADVTAIANLGALFQERGDFGEAEAWPPAEHRTGIDAEPGSFANSPASSTYSIPTGEINGHHGARSP